MNPLMEQKRIKTIVSVLAAGSALLCLPVPGLAKEGPSYLDLARQLNQAFVEVSEQVSPSVVVVRVAHKPSHMDLEDEDNPFLDMLPPKFRKQMEEQRKNREKKGEPSAGEKPVFDGQGSGIVVREEGYILTNRHVVEGADEIKVRFKDGSEFDGQVRGVDVQTDVAVIKIEPKGKKLQVAKLGDSDKTRVGEFAIAIGAPFELDYSVTFGHVSAKGRSRIIPDPRLDQDFIQTDANINPGNSGGPLVNISGEVIGINTLIRGLRTGIGFAIPVNLAREVADRLITDGKYTRAWLGVGIRALRDEIELKDVITGVNDGVVVTAIQNDGPAAKSDLKASDVITAVDGKPISTAQQLKNEIRSKKIGQAVTLDVYRMQDGRGKNIKIKVKTDAWPEETTPVAVKHSVVPEESSKTLGLTVKSLTKELAEQYGLEKSEGVVVTEVESGSVAEAKGIRPGDIITEVNQKLVNSPKQFRDAIKSADLKKGVILNFTSRETSKFEVLKESGE
jgi:serine protease Do